MADELRQHLGCLRWFEYSGCCSRFIPTGYDSSIQFRPVSIRETSQIKMQSIEFQLNDGHEFIELCNLLKLTGIASSGGQGKLMVSNGDVMVDRQAEIRKTAKIRAGQVVECLGARITVIAAGQV